MSSQKRSSTSDPIRVTPEWIAEIEAAAKAATPGPWVWVEELECVVGVAGGVDKPLDYVCREPEADERTEDMQHIARMDPPTVLALCAALREAWRERDSLLTGYELIEDAYSEKRPDGASLDAIDDALQKANGLWKVARNGR